MKNIFLILAVLFVSHDCIADEDSAWHQGACKEDVKKLCAEVKPGEGRIIQCLRAHEKDLSAECKSSAAAQKEAIKEVREQHRAELKQSNSEIHDACKEDAKKLCGDVQPGGGKILRCMKGKIDQASESCKAELQERKALRKNLLKELRAKRKN